MDVVYTVRKGDNNPELRHSLRSVAKNLTHDRVWITGYRPRWVSEAAVGHVDVPQNYEKFRIVPRNILAAVRDKRISDPFILFHDDMFVLKPTEEIPALNRGPLQEWIAQGSPWAPVYIKGMQRAIDLLESWGKPTLSYELHVPIVVHKELYLEMWDRSGLRWKDLVIPSCYRSLYGNYAELGGETIQDVKIHNVRDVPPEDAQFCSTNDGPFIHGNVGRWLEKRFPKPCRYELT